MQTTRSNVWTRTAPGALFVGTISAAPSCTVLAGAAAFAGVGAVAVVALVVPGSVLGRIAVIPGL